MNLNLTEFMSPIFILLFVVTLAISLLYFLWHLLPLLIGRRD